MILFFVAPELNGTLMFMLSVLILPVAMVFSQLVRPFLHFLSLHRNSTEFAELQPLLYFHS